jgi:hypothetical protein
MRFKSLFGYLCLALLVLLLMGQAIFLALPVLVETTLVDPLIQRHLPKKLPLGLAPSDINFKIEKIGVTHTLVSRIHIGQMLSADLLDFQYHLKGLKSVELEKITVSGLTLYAKMDAENQLHVNGKKFPGDIHHVQGDDSAKKDTDAQKEKDALDPLLVNLDSFLDFLPNQLVLKDATLSIARLDDKIIIPFEILSRLDARKKKVVLNARFYPLGQTIKTLIAADLTSGIEMVRIQSTAFHPEVLAGFFPEVGNFRVSGPVDIDILKTMDADWQLSLSQLKLDLPNLPGTRIKNFTASLRYQAGETTATGSFDLAGSLSPLVMRFDLNLAQKENFPLSFDLTLKNKAVNSMSLVTFPQVIFDHPQLLFSLKGNLVRQTGSFLLGCQNIMVTHGKDRVLVKKFSLNSGIKGDFSDKGNGMDLDIQSDLFGIKLFSKLGQAQITGVNLTGRAGVTKQMDPLIHLDTRIKDAKIDLSEFKIAAMGINARLPLVFPFKNQNTPGSFSINEIHYDNKITAALTGSITQNKTLSATIAGQTSIKGLDGFNLAFDGSVWGPDPSAMIDFVVDPFLLMPAHIKTLMPRLTLGEDSSLKLSSKGTIEYKPHGVKSRASVTMDGGNLFFPEMNLSLKGIAGSIDFNDLMVPESIPGQVLTIDKVQLNQFEFDTAKARFSIEDGKSVNIENLRFNWCNGLVSTESIRLPGKDNVLSLILYCDRLELAGLLKQMGAFHAEGEGTLSGRIPLVYSNGNISFDKGFLFSTPGKGGRVVIKDTKTLTAGIPFGTPEFAQLDLAREALKDFDYQWAKLELNTFEDTLEMKFELDGKPAKLLPFEYQQEIGSFVRVDATSPGSRFQGIKLNLNLKLPFNQVLKFGNKLNDIFN